MKLVAHRYVQKPVNAGELDGIEVDVVMDKMGNISFHHPLMDGPVKYDLSGDLKWAHKHRKIILFDVKCCDPLLAQKVAVYLDANGLTGRNVYVCSYCYDSIRQIKSILRGRVHGCIDVHFFTVDFSLLKHLLRTYKADTIATPYWLFQEYPVPKLHELKEIVKNLIVYDVHISNVDRVRNGNFIDILVVDT